MKSDERCKKENVLAEYIIQTQGFHTRWSLKCLGAELLYLINVIGQICFTDFFLGWEFTKYGVRAASFIELDVSF